METQNAGRATRDLMAFGVQRAGAGLGSASLTAGTGAGVAEARYAVWPTTQAAFTSDSTFVAPPAGYTGVRSDALEVWETDPSQMLELAGCTGATSDPWLNGTTLCTKTRAPNSLVAAGPQVMAVVFPGSATVRSWACLAVVTGINNAAPPVAPSLTLTLGLPERPTPPTGNCGPAPVGAGASWSAAGMFILPISARSYRVSWPDGGPALEMDADGLAGDGGYNVISRDIEQIRVRMGVVSPNAPDSGVHFFPETTPVRPGLDECTHATCGDFVTWPWDAGAIPPDRGLGSAQDELMRNVRVVELSITARSQRLDEDELLGSDGGVDEYGNIQDGFKRRHIIIRLAPRNFGYVGTEN